VLPEQLCNWTAVSGCVCGNVAGYSSAMTRTFHTNSAIMVVISHILSKIYSKNNEYSGATCGCNGKIHLEINNFY
jgi:hypothetical protein